jgi:hypothetical protein
MKPWFYNEQSITEFKEPVVYKGLNISVSKTKVKPPYIAVVTSPATSKEVTRTGGETEQEALDSAKQAIDKREEDAPKISTSGQTSVLLNVPSNDELLKDPTMYNNIYAKISKDQNGPTLVIGNEVYGAADLEADGFVRSYDRRMKKNRDSEDALPQIMFNASNKLLSQIGIKMNGRYTLDIEGKYRDDNEHTVYPLQFQGSTIHAGDKLRMSRPALTIGATREDAQPWFQREFEEAEIIKFPEPEKKVMELPNVQSYPDFLTGVKDLHNRRDRGEISQDSHDRLYQDLIHRFMRKESFETPWFLREYKDLSQAKTDIISKIQNLQIESDKDAKLLDRIYKLLSSDNLSPIIRNAFLQSTADDNLKNIDNVIQDLSKAIFSIESDYKKINNFLSNLEKTGSAIDTDAMISPGTQSFSTIFKGDEVGVKAFKALKSYGEGAKQKGKGEWALALLSNKIQVQSGKGDITVNGKEVEVKAEAGAGGGRLGQGGPAQNQAISFWSKLPSIKKHFTELGGKYLGIANALKYLDADLPLTNSKARSNRQKMLQQYFSPYFKNSNQIVKAFMQSDPKLAEKIYAAANFENYKAIDQFEGILMINFAQEKTTYFESGNDIIKMRDAGMLKSFGISFIPSRSRPPEIFAQLSMSSAKA